MRVSLIVAMSHNHTIGKEGDLPWRLSADLRRFKQLTMGHHIIMGRKTYESIGRLLPGRTTVIVSRQADYQVDGALIAGSLKEAIDQSAGDEEVFIIGGAEIYRQAMPLVERIYLTAVEAEVDGDTFFPQWNEGDWTLAEQASHQADEKNQYDYSFRIYDRNEVDG